MAVVDYVSIAREPWWWRHGRPASIWIQHLDAVQRFVQERQLKPIAAEHLISDDPIPIFAPAETGGAGQSMRALRPRPFPGGLRFAHLHLGEHVYKLDSAQWREFSKGILGSFREKLKQAETVTFDQLLELSEATAGLG